MRTDKSFIALLLLLVSIGLSGCGSDEQPQTESGAVVQASSQTTASAQELFQTEVEKLKEQLNSDQKYSLTKEELDLLLSENLLTKAEYLELTKLL
jgi:hypothetical protein